ncbi:hypothetical protein PIB30_059169 [Stylosanthes scabra]|uniref:Uncharacterized protein n=1 Tax=Stylosanthes scabra TaxID=79078 RepID=A0ABU6RL04_9FABA|nr:hypothetical protein [Stylosanthes scabra]
MRLLSRRFLVDFDVLVLCRGGDRPWSCCWVLPIFYPLPQDNNIYCPRLKRLALGPLRAYNSWTMMKVNCMRFHTPKKARGRTNDNSGIYLMGDAGQGQCDWGMIESQEEQVQDEPYQNQEETQPTLITDTEMPHALCSPLGEVDIVNLPKMNNLQSENRETDDDDDEPDSSHSSHDSD